jgi:mRNA interferase MazF
VRRGTVCWVDLEPAAPPEMGKTRPALVVSNSEHNAALHSLVVIPLSSQPGEIWPLRVKLEGPLSRTSFAVVPGIRQVSKSRILEASGAVSPNEMERIDGALSAYLAD